MEHAVRTDKVYAAENGGWIYEVWFGARAAVVGWCPTRLEAEKQASLA